MLLQNCICVGSMYTDPFLYMYANENFGHYGPRDKMMAGNDSSRTLECEGEREDESPVLEPPPSSINS